MFRYIKKADIFLFVALVFMGLFLSWLSLTDSDSGKNAVITVCLLYTSPSPRDRG